MPRKPHKGRKDRKEKFIRRAIKHPGELTEFAVQERCLTKKGKIDLSCIGSHIERLKDPKRKAHLRRALNLARVLRKIRRH